MANALPKLMVQILPSELFQKEYGKVLEPRYILVGLYAEVARYQPSHGVVATGANNQPGGRFISRGRKDGKER
jgi:hypothetical protein